MSVIIFFSASKNFCCCRNDVQAIDFLRKGSYAPGSASVSLRRSVNDYMLFHKLNSTVNKNDVHV